MLTNWLKRLRRPAKPRLHRVQLRPTLECLEDRCVPSGMPLRGFDSDNKTDIAIWKPNNGSWEVLTSASSFSTASALKRQWGQSGDIVIQNSDFDGDHLADMVVWRPSNGKWYIRKSSFDYDVTVSKTLGEAGDIPFQNSDFDGDGIADMAIWRPSNGAWLVRTSSDNFNVTILNTWGEAGDIPLQNSDFDDDGMVDMALWRPSDGHWYVRTSSSGYSSSIIKWWGQAGDIPLPNCDFDGDGAADMALWRPSDGTWYVRTSSSNFNDSIIKQTGQLGDIPLQNCDFDGDNRTDMAFWRPSNGTWKVLTSSSNFSYGSPIIKAWGREADTPIAGADFDGDGKTDMVFWRPGTGTWYILKSSSNFTTSFSRQLGLGGDQPIPGPVDQVVRIHAYFMRDDDGGRATTITPEAVSRWVSYTNSVHAQNNTGIRFAFDPNDEDYYDTLDYTLLNSLGGDPEGDDVELANLIAALTPDRMAVFFRFGSDPTEPTGNGFAHPPQSGHITNFVAMPGFDSLGYDGSLLTHEAGHYLGLYHTFVSWDDKMTATRELAARYIADPAGTHPVLSQEFPWTIAAAGTPGALDGDGLADTPPDGGVNLYQKHYHYPEVDFHDPDSPDSYWVDSHDIPDYLGEFKFKITPDRGNVMSYFGGGPEHFSPQQSSLMRQTYQLRFGAYGWTADALLAHLDPASGLLTVHGDTSQLDDTVILSQIGTTMNVSVSVNEKAANFYQMGIKAIQIDTGQGNDSISINATPSSLPVIVNAGLGNDDIAIGAMDAAVTVNGYSGTDAVTVGTPTAGLNNISGTLTITNTAGFYTLSLNDAHDNTGDNAALTIGSDGYGEITGLSAGKIRFQESRLNSLEISTGSGDDIFTINDTPYRVVVGGLPTTLNTRGGSDTIRIRGTSGGVWASLTVNAGDADDTIEIGNTANTLADITGPISIHGDGNSSEDSLTLNDADYINLGRQYTVTAGQIKWDSNPSVSFSTVESVTLKGGQRGDTFNIEGASASTALTIKGGVGIAADYFKMKPGVYAGALSLYGDGGLDTLDYSAYSSGVTVALADHSATDMTWIESMDMIIGSSGSDALRGDDGNNRLEGGSGYDILVGGGGQDTILGGNGLDLLIGGLGADLLQGGAGDDLLIAGTTSFDADLVALQAIRAEWTRNDLTGMLQQKYDARVAHLQSGGGLNGSYLLDLSSVFDDSSIDTLTGDGDLDLFFAKKTQDIYSLEKGEKLVELL